MAMKPKAHFHYFSLIYPAVFLTVLILILFWGLSPVKAAQTTTERTDNMTASQYSSFGFSDLDTNTPSTFKADDEDNPLANYSASTLSELYVGQTNRYDSNSNPNYRGDFFIAQNASTASGDALNLDHMANNQIGSSQKYPDNDIYSQCKNVIAFKPGNLNDADAASRRDVIFEDTLYTTEENKGSSKQRLRILTQDSQDSYQSNSSLTNDLSNSAWVSEINIRDQQGYLAMAAGDHDNDGAKEVAVYVPSDGGGRIVIYDIEADGSGWKPVQKCYWDVAASGRDRFGITDGVNRPIVNLSSTKTHYVASTNTNYDNLVLCISMPFNDKHNGNNNSECDVLAIDEANDNSIKRVFYNGLHYSGIRYKFPSATSADINGDGMDEIVVAGSKNISYYDDKNEKGYISSTENLINILLYDKSSKTYHFAWSTPQSIHANNTVAEDANDEMNNPIALTAGKYTNGTLQDTVFCGGAYYTFAANSQSGKDPISDGKFNCNASQDFKMPDSSYCFIAQAISANFVEDENNRMLEQIVVLTGDQAGTQWDQTDMNVSWVYAQNGSLHQEDTNKEYMNRQNRNDNGSCITLGALNADNDTAYIHYTGKTVGWSDPTVYSIMLSPPYWSELDYGSALNSRGSTTYTLTSSTGSGTGSSGNIGQCFGLSFSAGFSELGTGFSVGFSLDESASYTRSFQQATSHSTSYACTNGGGNGKDSVVLVLTPLCVYNYDVYIPDHKATESEVKNWNESLDGPTPKVGDLIPALNTKIGANVQQAPTYSTLTVSEYNDAARDYNAKPENAQTPLSLIDVNTLCPGIKYGDPSTYPQSLSDTNAAKKSDGTIDSTQSFASNSITIDQREDVKHTITCSDTTTDTTSNGYSVTLKGALKFEEKVHCLSFDQSGSVTGGLTGGWGQTWTTTNSKGISYAGELLALPASAKIGESSGKDIMPYGFNVALAKWTTPLANAESFDSNGNGTIKGSAHVIGYIVNGADQSIPTLPTDFHTVTSSADTVLLEWNNPSGPRAATSYKVYYTKISSGSASTYQPVQKDGVDLVVKGTASGCLVEGLEGGSTYSFKLEAYDAGGTNKSAQGPAVQGTTRASASDGAIINTAPKDAYIRTGDTATFSVAATPRTSGDRLVYQWQRLDLSHSYMPAWSNIFNANSDTYRVTASADNSADLNGTAYRCLITEMAGDGNSHTDVNTRSATLHVNEGTASALSLSIDAADNAASVTSVSADNKTVSANAGSAITAKGTLTGGADSQTITLICIPTGTTTGDPVSATGTTGSDGSYTITLDKGLSSGSYTAIAWYAGNDGTGHSSSDTIAITALDATKEYAIHYVLDGGANAVTNPTRFTQAGGIITLADGAKEGAAFAGWHRAADLSDTPPVSQIICSQENSDISLYATWQYTNYPITYALDGGTNAVTNPATYTIRDTVVFGTPTKDGYSFDGWYADSAFTQRATGIASGSTGAKTFYAKWKASSGDDDINSTQTTTLTDSATGIKVTANMHPDAVLAVTKLASGDADYDTLTAQNIGSVLGAYKLKVTCHNGADVPYTGNFTVSFPESLFAHLNKAEISTLIESVQGKYDVKIENGYLTLSTNDLGTYVISDSNAPTVTYQVHGRNYGWDQGWKTDGDIAGTTGQALRLEAIQAKIVDGSGKAVDNLGIAYQIHGQNYGWSQVWKTDGGISGTTGQSLRAEALRMTLTGSQAANYKLSYKVHVQNLGWTDWVSDGEVAGTTGQSLRIEAVMIKLEAK